MTQLRARGLTRLTDEAIREGFASVRWPGRMQWLSLPDALLQQQAGGRGGAQPLRLLVDGAHNPSAAAQLRSYVDQQAAWPEHFGRIAWVIGMSQHKDIDGVMRALLARPPPAAMPMRVICTAFNPPKTMPWIRSAAPTVLADAATAAIAGPAASGTSIEQAPSLVPALRRAFDSGIQHLHARRRPLAVLCGSLYLVGELYRMLEALPADSRVSIDD